MLTQESGKPDAKFGSPVDGIDDPSWLTRERWELACTSRFFANDLMHGKEAADRIGYNLLVPQINGGGKIFSLSLRVNAEIRVR